jgi:hypothetical protein
MNNIFTFNCQYRLGNQSPAICLWQSEKLGHIVKTSNLFCNRCPSGVYMDGDNNKEFLQKCFERRYDKNFLCKVLNKYSTETKIIIPDIWYSIFNTLQYVLDQPWCLDIGLTGSCIVNGAQNHADYDIVFRINNITEYNRWISQNSLPELIGKHKTDYYFYTNSDFTFFCSLWPNNKIIEIGNLFIPIIVTDLDFEIRYPKNIIFNLYDIECN